MSELINNREHRQEILKSIIRDLHAGHDPEDIKQRFAELLDQVGATEISELEQALINEGLPVEEIQELCDVHVAVFRESLDKQFDEAMAKSEQAEHPVNVFKMENEAITNVLDQIESILAEITEAKIGEDISEQLNRWKELHRDLLTIDNHYLRKENILFPFLEKNGITGPPSVMWGIHDDIRGQLKEISQLLETTDRLADRTLISKIGDLVKPALHAISEMIYKEENILFPMCMETLTADEWEKISADSPEVGFTLVEGNFGTYKAERDQSVEEEVASATPEGLLRLPSGLLSLEEIVAIFNNLQLDVTFVDKDDRVRFFTEGKERIFQRTRSVIGRHVQNCHPPSSVNIVEDILNDFKTKKRDSAEFWLPVKDMFVYIRYFALYDDNGEYMGTLEVTQNIKPLQEISGEKRIYDGA